MILSGLAIAIIALGLDQTVPDSTYSQQASTRASTATDAGPEATTGPASEPTTSASPELDGHELYTSHCSSCHGIRLEGDVGPALDRGSEASELSDRRMALAILEGSDNGMPAFDERLTPEQIDQIIAYVRDTQQT